MEEDTLNRLREYKSMLQNEYNQSDKSIKEGKNIPKFQSRLIGKIRAYEKAINELDNFFPELRD